MNRNRGGPRPFIPGANAPSKGKSVGPQYGQSSRGPGFGNNSHEVSQLHANVADLSIDPANDDDNWQDVVSKGKNRGGTSGQKQWGSSVQSSAPKSWAPGKNSPGGAWQGRGGEPNKSVGRGNKVQPTTRGWENTYMAPPPPLPVIPPPLQNGWKWNTINRSTQPKASDDKQLNYLSDGDDSAQNGTVVDDDDDDDILDDDDDISDGFESDESQKSHNTRKKNKMLKVFFEKLDELSIEDLNAPSRQWHCPACQNGPGAIDWYRGLQPLMAHAKTKGSKRVKLHREFAELLDEELHRRGTSVIQSGEAYGLWRGLQSEVPDKEIVWPPMVMVRNTQLKLDDDDKWLGMGNQELVDYFKSYQVEKARHSYGPKGHRGISLLIFEAGPTGYVEAEALHNHFVEEGRDRDAWDRRRVLFYPGGERQLYGYLARKEDMDEFNQHSHGKSKLKFEMRSYKEMVAGPMKQMSEDNQLLTYLKNKVVKEQRHSKFLEESFDVMTAKLRKTMKENQIVKERTKLQHKEYKEEMDHLEQFYKDQVHKIHEQLEEKEIAFDKSLQEERERKKQSNVESRSNEEKKIKKKEIDAFIDSQSKGIEEFVAEREKLVKLHNDQRVEMKKRHMEEEVELEKEFDALLTELMKKYSPEPSEEITSTASLK